ncbi:dermatopontin-like [Acropora muricata]|uniref:dermatopontin-like n=1 Tax=Acropora muricata TaxID=159855 RepID=UPI0034E4CC7B
MTMKGSKLALVLLFVGTLEILLFTGSDAFCSSSRPSSPRWFNTWGKNFGAICGNGYSILIWQSQHRYCQGDRIHFFHCKRGPFSPSYCSVSRNVNQYDRLLAFKCPNNGVITAVGSNYNSISHDRRFSFRCCYRPGYIAHTCRHTAFLNTWYQPLRFVVPSGYFLVGAFSEHQNLSRDRIWKFEICKFSRVVSSG